MEDVEERGLSAEEVAERVRAGRTNAVRERTSRSYADILRENVFTLFNLILTVLVIAVLIAGSPRDALFGLVVVINAAVGVVQEVRAKRTLDRLTLLSAPRARVVRDGGTREIPLEDVVCDDVVELAAGDQVPADGVVLASDGLEVDESLLTGESAPVAKHAGDNVLSGSFAVAGRGTIRATQVGEQAYARKLTAEARRFRLVRSELRAGVNSILKYVLWLMIPIGILTVLTQLGQHETWNTVVIATAAALSAMVPQGLVLLTSIAFAVAVLALARRDTLVQELAAVEVLARVDVVCVDKTGTLTEPALQVLRLEPLAEGLPLEAALGALSSAEDNATARALKAAYPPPDGWEARGRVAFSSGRKWSGADLGERGTWVLGAPEVLLADAGGHADVRERAAREAAEGARVLVLARAAEALTPERPPASLEPAALVVLAERVRPDAAETLRYFAEQGVAVRVLSGDSPAAVARRVGLDPGEPVDARTLPADDAALTALVERTTVFGRITPHDKRRIVEALQRAGRTVAMTGDGVNDVPALKSADLGIAMGSGAGAARAVAQVVLLNGRFATLPRVVAEGRRVIADIERVANLFLTKTVYAVLLALATAAAAVPFPLLPRHITVVDALTIGIPAFFLALAPDDTRYRPGFVRRVLRFAAPAGIGAAAAAFAAYLVTRGLATSTLLESRTAATLVLTAVGLWVLGMLARPLTGWRLWLLVAMAAGFALVIAVPFARSFFALVPLPPVALGLAALCAAAGVGVIEAGLRVTRWRRQ